MESTCPCGSGETYLSCCGLYISGQQKAPTAEKLMRSRFTAFAQKNEAYLINSWDPKTRPKSIDFSQDLSDWQHLEVKMTKKGQPGDAKGIVEFKAFYRLNDQNHAMNEISRFVNRNGEWLYLDGKVKSIANLDTQSNQGKNALCGCGSGKKFKRCCGKQ